MLPSRLVENRSDRIEIVDPPLSIPTYEMAMIWHEPVTPGSHDLPITVIGAYICA